jgi:hypothetical protein
MSLMGTKVISFKPSDTIRFRKAKARLRRRLQEILEQACEALEKPKSEIPTFTMRVTNFQPDELEQACEALETEEFNIRVADILRGAPAGRNGEQPPIINAEVVSDADDFIERERQEIVIVRETGVALLSVLRIGQALRIIKERKLYRTMTIIRDGKPIKIDGYDTLEQYTRARFAFAKSRRAQVLNLEQVFADLELDEKSTESRLLLLTEPSFRPFYRLNTEQRQIAMKEIEAVSEGEHIQAPTIRKVINRLYPNPKKKKESNDFPSEELIDKWIGKFVSDYPKANWDPISEVIEQRAKYWRSELVEV